MKHKSMGWQPEQIDNRIGIIAGMIGGVWQYLANFHLPVDFGSKLLEAVITAGLAGFAGMVGKELFIVTRRALMAYFKTRKK